MISFDSYQKSGNSIVKYGLYLVVAAIGVFLVYKVLTHFWPNLFNPRTIITPNPIEAIKTTRSPKELGDNYGYSSDLWNYKYTTQLGAQATGNEDPSNDVQKFEKIVDPLTGRTSWEPKVMQTPQDYITDDELDTVINRQIQGYNKCQLDWMTRPAITRDGSLMWFGQTWPNDDGSPLSNMRGACVNKDDIVHHGLYNTSGDRWGYDNEACKKNACTS